MARNEFEANKKDQNMHPFPDPQSPILPRLKKGVDWNIPLDNLLQLLSSPLSHRLTLKERASYTQYALFGTA